jgi:hypothetical protein
MVVDDNDHREGCVVGNADAGILEENDADSAMMDVSFEEKKSGGHKENGGNWKTKSFQR